MADDRAVEPRHILIIGAGPGLGAAIARRFSRRGFTVTLAARNQQNLDEIARPLREEGGDVATFVADARSPGDFAQALDTLAGKITPGVVVYNVAQITDDTILTIGIDHLIDTFAINAVGAVIAAQTFTPAMRAAKSGTYIVTGGYGWLHPHPEYASLSLGKAGTRSVVALMHDELKKDGVHAVSTSIAGVIAPGTVLDPDAIADLYWNLHVQDPAEWNHEILVPAHSPNDDETSMNAPQPPGGY